MKRFLFLANNRFPTEKAHGHQIMAMSQAFAARVPEFSLVVPAREGVTQQDPFAYYGVPQTFLVRALPVIDLLHVAWFPKWLAFWLERLTFARSVRKRVLLNADDVAYGRDVLTMPRSGRGLRIWEMHRLPTSPAERRALRDLDGIVTVTQALKRSLMEMGIPGERVHVAPDAAAEGAFRPAVEYRDSIRTELGITASECLLLYTGKFTTMGMSKGLDEAIEAVRQLRAQGVSVSLLAVGGTPDELKRYSRPSSEDIHLLGHVPQSSLKQYYAAADALIMPFPWTEHYAYAMSPLKLFEYLQTGKPIITSDLPSVREVVGENEVIFCEPGSSTSLTESIRWLLAHPEEAAAKAKHAEERSHAYTWEARAEGIIRWILTLPLASVRP